MSIFRGKIVTVIIMKSVWQDNATLPSFKPLKKDVTTDVLIIGGGMAGILCAYSLKNAGISAVLVESGKICSSVSAHTTAKITSQHGFIYSKLLKEFGANAARLYYNANQTAISRYRQLCRKIDCDFNEATSVVYSNNPKKIEAELSALSTIGIKADYKKDLPLPMPTSGGISFSRQAQFNPLKFVSAICPDLTIHENTRVRELAPNTALCDNAKIKAKIIIVATHFPIDNKHGNYFLKMYQDRSYVIALENALPVDGMYVDENEKGLSFRNYGDLLLLGGGSHRTGKNGGNWTELEKFALKYYPSAKIKYRWVTQDCMTLDGVPYIGNYSKNTPDMYVATGFNKWGMTSSMVAAMLLTDAVCGKKNAYAEVFSPSRSILRPKLACNAVSAVCNLLTPTAPRCPHLGCALKWNSAEHSWDCPCHGSRFDKNGKLLDNPATGDIKIRP